MDLSPIRALLVIEAARFCRNPEVAQALHAGELEPLRAFVHQPSEDSIRSAKAVRDGEDQAAAAGLMMPRAA